MSNIIKKPINCLYLTITYKDHRKTCRFAHDNQING